MGAYDDGCDRLRLLDRCPRHNPGEGDDGLSMRLWRETQAGTDLAVAEQRYLDEVCHGCGSKRAAHERGICPGTPNRRFADGPRPPLQIGYRPPSDRFCGHPSSTRQEGVDVRRGRWLRWYCPDCGWSETKYLGAAAKRADEPAAAPAPPTPLRRRERAPEPAPRPAPATTSTTSTGASTMSGSIGDAATGIRASNDTAGDAVGILGQAIHQLEQARSQLQAAVAGSGQGDASESVGMYGRAIEAIQDAQRAVSGAQGAAEGVAARL